MHKQIRYGNRIFSLLLILGLLLSTGAPLAVFAEDGNQPTLSSGTQERPLIVDETQGLEPPPMPQIESGSTPEQNGQIVDGAPLPNLATDANAGDSAELMFTPLILDYFNRANGPLGSNWNIRNGNCNVVSNTAVCGSTGRATYNGAPFAGNAVEGDVAAVGTSTQYTGFVLNYGAGVTNLFIKVQQQNASGQFHMAACYTGNNNTGAPFGLGFFNLTSPFTTAHMRVTRVASTVTITFTGIDYGTKPNQIYTCTGAPAPEGTGVGIVGYDGTASVDNFAVSKVVGNTLWDQPPVPNNAWVDQLFPDQPSLSAYLADDFTSSQTWSIDSIFIPGEGWNGFTTLMNATSLTWMIFTDNGGIPAGDPSGGGSPPVWSLSLPPTNPQVTISTGTLGFQSNTLLVLTTPIILPPGHYWLVFYPTLTLSPNGQFGRNPAFSSNGGVGKFINPGGGWGVGTAWQNWNVIGAAEHDIAFSIGGEVKYGQWKSINPINGLGRSRPAAASVGGKLYVLGGEISGGRANTVEEYDPSTGFWTTQSGLMPTPASNICAAALGTDIYIPGGYDASLTTLNTLQVYHTTTDTWNTITTDPLPAAVLAPGCAALSGKLYVFGGQNSGGIPVSSAYVYDPLASAGARWTTLPSMAYTRAYVAGTAVNGKVYAVGGLSGSDTMYVEAFNPADNSWHTVSSLNQARAGAGAFALGNDLVVCGGGFYSYYNSCERFNTNQGYSGVWISMASMITGRRTFGYAKLGPALYAVAGYNGSYLTSAERWTIDSFIPSVAKMDMSALAFDSQFNGNATGWLVAAGSWYYDSNYLFTYGDPDLWSSAVYNKVFSNLDYQARMIRYGSESFTNNLLIRGTVNPKSTSRQWYSQYAFQYTNDGYYSVWKNVAGGGAIPLIGWTPSPAIITGQEWNTLRVVAITGHLYFYINGQLVWTGVDNDLASGYVGIGMYKPSPGSSDLLRVDWAKLYTDSNLLITDVVSPEQQMLNDAANLRGGGDSTHSP